jgi:hypothetical protein
VTRSDYDDRPEDDGVRSIHVYLTIMPYLYSGFIFQVGEETKVLCVTLRFTKDDNFITSEYKKARGSEQCHDALSLS